MIINNHKKVFVATVVVGIAGLIFLSGCEWFSSKKSSGDNVSVANKGDVLLSIDGKPALTVAEYEDQLNLARQGNQEIDMVLQMMPDAERKYIYQVFETGKIMQAWIEKEGIDKTEDFQKQRKQLHEAMDFQLFMKFFYDKNKVDISDEEMKSFYNEKKDSIPGMQISAGGIEISYVRFDSKAKADAFLEKVKEVKDKNKFKSIAESSSFTVSNSIVNDKSSLSDSLKNSVLAIKSFPKIESVKVGDNSYWVLLASGKSDVKYHDINSPQVQQGLKKMMADERRQKQLEEFIDKKKKDYNVVTNDEYFTKKEAQKRSAMEEMAKKQGNVKPSNEKEDQKSESEDSSADQE